MVADLKRPVIASNAEMATTNYEPSFVLVFTYLLDIRPIFKVLSSSFCKCPYFVSADWFYNEKIRLYEVKLFQFEDFWNVEIFKGPKRRVLPTKVLYQVFLGVHLCVCQCWLFIVKTQRNSTQLNSTQSNSKSNFVGLDIVLTWNPPHPPHHHPQTFQALLGQLESWNLAQTLTRRTWLR